MPTSATRPYRGVFPVVPTIFNADGSLDLPGQLRCVDFMIDAGSNGLCILANFSEQFVLSDAERDVLTRAILAHVARNILFARRFDLRAIHLRARRLDLFQCHASHSARSFLFAFRAEMIQRTSSRSV